MAEGHNQILDLGYDAAAAITKYTAVKFVTDSITVTPCTAEGDLCIGVAMYGVTAAEILQGKGCTVRHMGIALMVVGTGGVTFGTIGVMDAAGKVVASNTGARPLGIVMATGLVNEYVPVLLNLGQALIP